MTRQALEIWRTVLGEAHPDYALSLNNLAGLCAATARHDEAMLLMEQAATIDDRMKCRHLLTLQSGIYPSQVSGNVTPTLPLFMRKREGGHNKRACQGSSHVTTFASLRSRISCSE
ncbi:MAG: tetratricopeptide repeat protein [Candidatus Tectomicrobia bacterium]|nr:tetratricopeptide repeat protein [Candidatus Tectomicrobia bacterium]